MTTIRVVERKRALYVLVTRTIDGTEWEYGDIICSQQSNQFIGATISDALDECEKLAARDPVERFNRMLEEGS